MTKFTKEYLNSLVARSKIMADTFKGRAGGELYGELHAALKWLTTPDSFMLEDGEQTNESWEDLVEDEFSSQFEDELTYEVIPIKYLDSRLIRAWADDENYVQMRDVTNE